MGGRRILVPGQPAKARLGQSPCPAYMSALQQLGETRRPPQKGAAGSRCNQYTIQFPVEARDTQDQDRRCPTSSKWKRWYWRGSPVGHVVCAMLRIGTPWQASMGKGVSIERGLGPGLHTRHPGRPSELVAIIEEEYGRGTNLVRVRFECQVIGERNGHHDPVTGRPRSNLVTCACDGAIADSAMIRMLLCSFNHGHGHAMSIGQDVGHGRCEISC